MIKNKERIDQIIKEHKPDSFDVKIRTIADNKTNWSKTLSYNESTIKLIYNSKIVDGVKIIFRYTTLIINARHKL